MKTACCFSFPKNSKPMQNVVTVCTAVEEIALATLLKTELANGRITSSLTNSCLDAVIKRSNQVNASQ